jgi:predicted nucleic acid-binding protein
MPDKVALDSNILAAMFFKEDASPRALKAVIEPDLITLDLAVAEVGNVAWKLVIRSKEDKELTLTALQKCLAFISETCDVIRAQDIAAEAYEISVEARVAFYDSLFLALARREQVPLLTLDRKLYERIGGRMNVKLI